MLNAARSLVLKDRDAARKALVDEMRRQADADVDQRLDALAEEERSRAASEAAEKKRLAAEEERRRKADAATAALADARRRFDAAVAELGAAFVECERLREQASILTGRKSAPTEYKWAYVAAMWHGARQFCGRLGLLGMPGGQHKIRSLSGKGAK
jgi:thioredoxin-like negative regulator of GroEL